MRNLLIIIAVILSLTQLTFAVEWNDIKPLQTTRPEVIKLLGDPLPRNRNDFHTGERFDFDGQSVYIRWAVIDSCDRNVIDFQPAPDLNVVAYQITVVPREPLPLADIEKLNPPRKPLPGTDIIPMGPVNCLGSGGKWSCSIINNEAGFGYTTSTENKVIWLYYFPSEKEVLAWKEKVPLCSDEKK